MVLSSVSWCAYLESEQHNVQKHTPQKKQRCCRFPFAYILETTSPKMIWKHTSAYLPWFSSFFSFFHPPVFHPFQNHINHTPKKLGGAFTTCFWRCSLNPHPAKGMIQSDEYEDVCRLKPTHLPSRNLTYPPKMAFWRWFSFSQGGIC